MSETPKITKTDDLGPNHFVRVQRDAYRCSYCKSRATFVGSGQDGDFYCPNHVHKAPGPVEPV